MKWYVENDLIVANSSWHDEGESFKWWIIENKKGGCTLNASKELLEKAIKFDSVIQAMNEADKRDLK